MHILYFTVYKEDGLAYFKNDIYLYDQMIWESSTGHKKATFKIPPKRFIDVKKNAGQKSENKTQTIKPVKQQKKSPPIPHADGMF